MEDEGKGALENIDLSISCAKLDEEQIGWFVLQFLSCPMYSPFFFMLPGQPATWVCVQTSLLQVSCFWLNPREGLLFSLLFCLET